MSSWLKQGFEYVLILCSGLLYAISLKYFVMPSKVILTGTEGIAVALSYYFENYLLFLVLYSIFQSILLIFAFIFVSRTFAFRSLLVVSTVLLTMAFLPDFQFAQPESADERILLVIFGGLLAGLSKACAFRNRGSTGDEDILGAYFAVKFLKPVGSIAIVAAIVSTSFGLSLDFYKNGNFENIINTLMYTSIYIFISAQSLNTFYRKFSITILEVITQDCNSVKNAISSSFEHRTYTIQEVTGGHTGDPFWMVKTIVTQEELDGVIKVVRAADPASFYYHYSISGISDRYYIEPIG